MAREMTETKERRASPSRQSTRGPVREMIGLRDTINGLFEDFFSGRPLLATRLSELGQEQGFVPPVDICDTEKELIVFAGLLGVKKEDCRIEVQDGSLVISGECKAASADQGEYLRRELPSGEFYRAFELPADVRTDQVRATYHDGLVEIHLPKSEEAKTRRIEIQ